MSPERLLRVTVAETLCNVGNGIPAISDLPDGFVLEFGAVSLIAHGTSSYAHRIGQKCPWNPGQSIE
jgi:hypothetical protein